MTFGENLKALRSSRSVSQRELADELGFSFQNVSKWERNESLPDIGTLVAIAKYFSTTTDALLGIVPEEKTDTLSVSLDEMKAFRTYPGEEVPLTGELVFAVDAEGKIAAIVYVPRNFPHRNSYVRGQYDPFVGESTLVYEGTYRFRNEYVYEQRKLGIPEGGFLLAVPDSAFDSKRIMEFIIPDEYADFLDGETHPLYRNTNDGRGLFGDVLRRNELDGVTVELTDTGVLFKKPGKRVDPMAVNINDLAAVVRRELKKEHDKQIFLLQSRIDELECLIDDLESRLDELESELQSE